MLPPTSWAPISLKGRFHGEGLDGVCGYVSLIGEKKSIRDKGVLVQRHKQAGAIVFVKTNIHISMLVSKALSNIIGSTMNPYKRILQVDEVSGG